MDFANDPGTPVLAAADGTVVWVETGAYPRYQMAAASAGAGEHTVASPMGGSLLLSDTHELTGTATVQLGNPYGNVVILRHDWGWQGEPVYTLYGHLLEVFVQSGERVRAGDLLAGVGNTGDSTGPHLHFEVRVGQNHYNATRNPALWIAPYEGWGTLAGLVTDSNGMALDRVKLTAYPIDLKYAAGLDAESPHTTTTYVRGQVQPDDSWGENFVLPDLPAGTYRLVATTNHERLVTEVTIKAGVTSFVRLQQQHSVTPVPPATESASAG
jgi:biotin carboxyl carrier protein